MKKFMVHTSKILLCVLGLLSASGLMAADYTWNGKVSGNWATLANWDPLPTSIPGSTPGDNITLPFVAGYSPVLDQNRTIANLTFSNQTLDLNGFVLSVTGSASSLGNGLIKNGNLDLTNAGAESPTTDISSGNRNLLTIGSSLVPGSFLYTVTGLGFMLSPNTASSTNPDFFLVPNSTATTVTLIVTNPSNSNVFKTLQLAINSQNQFTGVKVIEEDESFDLAIMAYTLGNSKTFLNFSSTFLSTLFQACTSSVQVETQNFVRTQVLQVAYSDKNTVDQLPVESMLQSTTYLDGFGRPIQQVSRQVTPQKKDLVQIVEYDIYGRTPRDYLPYASDMCNGTYIPGATAKAQQQYFYTQNADPLIPKVIAPSLYTGIQNNAYSERIYDGSPFDRVVEQAAPGDPWKLVADGTAKTQKQLTRTNTSTDSVLLWQFDFTTSKASALGASSANYYAAGTLFVTELTDENGSKQTVFADKMGRTLLRRVQKNATTNMNTYYIYDDYGSLVYVIPPQATSQMAAQNWSVSPVTVTSSITWFNYTWLYYFQYDQRRRTIGTHAPGAALTSIVYDALDRPVAVQDGNMYGASTKSWLFAKYDVLGRKVMTGTWNDSRTQAALQTAISTDGTNGKWCESPSSVAGNVQGYTKLTYPNTVAESNLLSVAFYDAYDFDQSGTTDYAYDTTGLGSQAPVATSRVLGMPTGARVRNLETNAWLTSAVFYDKFGRAIQTQKNNALYLTLSGGTQLQDKNTVFYDFLGRPTKTRQVHTPGGSLAQITVAKRYQYDHAGRLTYVRQATNSDAEVIVSHRNYNELGQCIEKNLHSEDGGATYLQSLDYRFNIRGWLTSLNNSTLTNDQAVTNNDASDLFGMNMVYEGTFSSNTPRYNGDITAMRWKTKNASQSTSANEKAYVYAYDYASQLTSALYQENTSGTWGNAGGKYNESNIAYDLNGNITALTRTDSRGTATPLDNLTYTFNGNQLKAMADAGDKTAGFLSNSTATTQYGYDANGNLLTDLNRNFSVAYNFLNLMNTVSGTNGNAGKNITYAYSAAGQKLKKTVQIGTSTVSVTWYVDNFVYDGTNNIYSLQFFTTDEGRAIPNGTSFKYQYTITDHVGNARLSFDKGSDGKAEVVQEDHYYAFGLRLGGQSYVNGQANRYLFQGAETEGDLGLLNTYDYGWRQYDPALGRWHNPDPMQQYTSPYCFVGNNPMNTVDIGGMDGVGEGGNSNGALTGGYFGGNYGGGGRFGSDGLSASGEAAVAEAAAGEAAEAAQAALRSGGSYRGAIIGGTEEEEIGGGRGWNTGVNRGGNGLSRGSTYSGVVGGRSVSFGGTGAASYVWASSGGNGNEGGADPTAVAFSGGNGGGPPQSGNIPQNTPPLSHFQGNDQGEMSLREGTDLLFTIKSTVLAGIEYYLTKHGAVKDPLTKGIGKANLIIGTVTFGLSLHEYVKDPTPVNLGKVILNGGSFLLAPTGIGFTAGLVLSVLDYNGLLDGIYSDSLAPLNNMIITSPEFQNIRNSYLNILK